MTVVLLRVEWLVVHDIFPRVLLHSVRKRISLKVRRSLIRFYTVAYIISLVVAGLTLTLLER